MDRESATQRINREMRLKDIEEKDLAYRTWKNSMEAVAADFEAYASVQPEEIRNMLRCYAGGAKMMYQRILSLACQYMRFADESDSPQ